MDNNSSKCPVCGISINLNNQNKCIRCGTKFSCSVSCSGDCLKCAMKRNKKPKRDDKGNKC